MNQQGQNAFAKLLALAIIGGNPAEVIAQMEAEQNPEQPRDLNNEILMKLTELKEVVEQHGVESAGGWERRTINVALKHTPMMLARGNIEDPQSVLNRMTVMIEQIRNPLKGEEKNLMKDIEDALDIVDSFIRRGADVIETPKGKYVMQDLLNIGLEGLFNTNFRKQAFAKLLEFLESKGYTHVPYPVQEEPEQKIIPHMANAKAVLNNLLQEQREEMLQIREILARCRERKEKIEEAKDAYVAELQSDNDASAQEDSPMDDLLSIFRQAAGIAARQEQSEETSVCACPACLPEKYSIGALSVTQMDPEHPFLDAVPQLRGQFATSTDSAPSLDAVTQVREKSETVLRFEAPTEGKHYSAANVPPAEFYKLTEKYTVNEINVGDDVKKAKRVFKDALKELDAPGQGATPDEISDVFWNLFRFLKTVQKTGAPINITLRTYANLPSEPYERAGIIMRIQLGKGEYAQEVYQGIAVSFPKVG